MLNYLIPFDTYKDYNELREGCFIKNKFFSLSFSHNSTSEISNAVQEIFNNGCILEDTTSNDYISNKMGARTLPFQELETMKEISQNSLPQTNILFQEQNTQRIICLIETTQDQRQIIIKLLQKFKQKIGKHIQEAFITQPLKLFNQNIQPKLKSTCKTVTQLIQHGCHLSQTNSQTQMTEQKQTQKVQIPINKRNQRQRRQR